MAVFLMNKGAFFKWDSLLMTFMLVALLTMVLAVFASLESYDEGYKRYAEELNMDLALTFGGVSECCKEEADY